jgi:hypothetical protein
LTPTNTLVTATENTVPKINVLEVFLALPFKARANARLGKCALVDRVPSMANLLIKPHLHLLEPIRKLLESDESDVIPYEALDSLESARCGPMNTAWPRIEAAFVTQAI